MRFHAALTFALVVSGCGRSGVAPAETDTLPDPQLRDPVLDLGSGLDGSVIVASAVNLTTTPLANGRACADAIWYPVVALTPSAASLGSTPAAGCLEPGDEVMLLNMAGVPGSTINVGIYEMLRVAMVSGVTVTFARPKLRSYGTFAADDSGIGVGASQQRVVLQRVPNYRSLIVQAGASITVNPFDGQGGGVLALRVQQTARIDGGLQLLARGYRAGISGVRPPEGTEGPIAAGGGGGGGGSGGHNGTNVCGASGLGNGGAQNGYCGNASVATYSPCPATPNMCTTNGCGGNATGSAGGGGAGYGFGAGTGGTSPGGGGAGGNKVADSGQTGGSPLLAGFGGGGGFGGRDSGGGGGGGAPRISFPNASPADLARLVPGGGGASGAGGGGGGGAGDFQCAGGGSGGSATGTGGARGLDNCVGADSVAGSPGFSGNPGGGILVLYADTIVVTGTIDADGGAGGTGGSGGGGAAISTCNTGRGGGGGGGGAGANGAAGGSVLLVGRTLSLGTDRVTARGGAPGGAGSGGSGGASAGAGGVGAAGALGGAGVIAVRALELLEGTTLPAAGSAADPD